MQQQPGSLGKGKVYHFVLLLKLVFWSLPGCGGRAEGELARAQLPAPAPAPAPRAASPALPALPAAHDGTVQEVLAHGGAQHPQQQAHQQEAGAYLKKENPFNDSPEEEKEHEEQRAALWTRLCLVRCWGPRMSPHRPQCPSPSPSHPCCAPQGEEGGGGGRGQGAPAG